jgi:hypothetical protein
MDRLFPRVHSHSLTCAIKSLTFWFRHCSHSVTLLHFLSCLLLCWREGLGLYLVELWCICSVKLLYDWIGKKISSVSPSWVVDETTLNKQSCYDRNRKGKEKGNGRKKKQEVKEKQEAISIHRIWRKSGNVNLFWAGLRQPVLCLAIFKSAAGQRVSRLHDYLTSSCLCRPFYPSQSLCRQRPHSRRLLTCGG